MNKIQYKAPERLRVFYNGQEQVNQDAIKLREKLLKKYRL